MLRLSARLGFETPVRAERLSQGGVEEPLVDLASAEVAAIKVEVGI